MLFGGHRTGMERNTNVGDTVMIPKFGDWIEKLKSEFNY